MSGKTKNYWKVNVLNNLIMTTLQVIFLTICLGKQYLNNFIFESVVFFLFNQKLFVFKNFLRSMNLNLSEGAIKV